MYQASSTNAPQKVCRILKILSNPESLRLADALPLVRFRAQAMLEAVPVGTGAMAAILGLEADAVRRSCADVSTETGEVVEAVNFNDPKQTVIAGTKAGVDQACIALKAAGAKRALPLPGSARGCHSPVSLAESPPKKPHSASLAHFGLA